MAEPHLPEPYDATPGPADAPTEEWHTLAAPPASAGR